MQELIENKIKELTENGKVDEIVTKAAVEFIQNVVKNVLSGYSDVGKALETKLKTSVLSGIETMDFISYSKSLTDMIEGTLNKSIVEYGIEPAKEMLKNFVGDLEKTEWKLSEIIELFKEKEVIPEDHGESGEIAYFYEVSDYGTVYVAFDEDIKKSDRRYSCKYRLIINKKNGELYSPTIDGIDAHPITEMGGLYGFDLFLFKLYAMKCTIICDTNDVETEWSTWND